VGRQKQVNQRCLDLRPNSRPTGAKKHNDENPTHPPRRGADGEGLRRFTYFATRNFAMSNSIVTRNDWKFAVTFEDEWEEIVEVSAACMEDAYEMAEDKARSVRVTKGMRKPIKVADVRLLENTVVTRWS